MQHKWVRTQKTTHPSRVSAEQDRLLTLINAVADAIIYINNDGKVILYNAAVLNLIDTNEDLRGHSIDAILPLKDEAGHKVAPTSLFSENNTAISRNDLTYSYDEIDTLNLDVLVTPMRANYGSRGDGYIFVLRDITKAKTLDEERDEFISVVSHELRTPVAIVEGTISNAQMMLERNMSADKLKEAFEEAHKQILYLASMVNDLSTLSRAERGVADTPEDIVVEDLAREIYEEYEPQATAKGLQFNLELGPKLGVLFTSKLYLSEILQNFITNALKYSIEGSITFIARRQDNGVYFAVKDTGIGISKSDQGKIFRKFYRSEDYRTRQTNGTGLGLYVVSKLADKLHATIEVQSRLNHGSTFSFFIENIRP